MTTFTIKKETLTPHFIDTFINSGYMVTISQHSNIQLYTVMIESSEEDDF